MAQFIDKEISLDIFAEIKKEGVKVPCLINKRGILQFVFAWSFDPIHATRIRDQDMASILDGIRSNKGLEQLNFVNKIRPSVSGKAQHDLIDLNNHKRKKKLSQKGLRRELDYIFFATYTINEDAKEPEGFMENVLAKGQTIFEQNFAKSTGEFDQAQRIAALNGAHNAWLEYDQVLKGKYKFNAAPLNCDEIYQYTWELFNRDACPGLPYRLYADLDRGEFQELDRMGNDIEDGDYYEMASYLIPPDACPKCKDRDYLYLPGKERYVGCISFEDIPDDFGSPQQKYRFLWDGVVKDSFHPYEMDIVTQITYADPKDSLEQSRKYAQQQKGEARKKDEKGREDRALKHMSDAASEAQDDLIQGDLPCFVATVINVYAPNEVELRSALRRIKNSFSRPTIPYIEQDYAWKFWLQSTPIRPERLCTSLDGIQGLVPNDYRLKLATSAAMGLIQAIGIRSLQKSGVEYISKEGRVPVLVPFVDEFGNPRHGIQYGLSGSGKSASFIKQLDSARLQGMKISIQDLPDASGRGSYQDWVRFHGGTIVDTARTANNLLELPEFDDPGLEADYYADVEGIITSLVINRDNPNLPLDEIDSIIGTSVYRFYKDPTIRERIYAARKGGIGSDEWQNYPTLFDYYDRIDDSLNPEDSEKTKAAIDHIRLRLRGWLQSHFADKIARPSDVDVDSSQILLFSLRGVKSEKESRVFGLSSFNAAMRRSLNARRSFYGCDELSVQLQFPTIANYVGKSLATARKSGVSVFLLTQDCDAVENCAAAAKIKANLSYYIIGRVAPGAVESYERIHGIPKDYLTDNASLDFKPIRTDMATNWFIEDNGLRTAVQSFASPIQLGLVLNDEYEVAAREYVFSQYTDRNVAAAQFGALTEKLCKEGVFFKEYCKDKGIVVEKVSKLPNEAKEPIPA